MTTPTDYAFPVDSDSVGQHECWNCLTKREKFAESAMKGLCVGYADHSLSKKDLVELAVEFADALIEELDKEKSR